MNLWPDPTGMFVLILGISFLGGSWLPRFLRPKTKDMESPGGEDPKLTKLKEINAKLLRVYSHQRQIILYQNKITQQLKIRIQYLNNFIHLRTHPRQEKEQEKIAKELGDFSRELTPLIEGLGKGDFTELSTEYLKRIKNRSASIKEGIVETLASLRKQRDELLARLKRQENELLQKEREIEMLSALTRQLQKKEEGAEDRLTVEPDAAELQETIDNLRQVVKQQQQAIRFLKDDNLRLQEQNQKCIGFFNKESWRQHQPIAALSEFKQDFFHVIQKDESIPQELTSHIIHVLEERARPFEDRFRKWRSLLDSERQEILTVLEKRDFLLLKKPTIETADNPILKLQEELRKVLIDNSHLKEELKEKYKLQEELEEAEKNLQNLTKKYQALERQWETVSSGKGLADENTVLKKTVVLLQEKLQKANQQTLAFKLEYEKLLEEYEKIFIR